MAVSLHTCREGRMVRGRREGRGGGVGEREIGNRKDKKRGSGEGSREGAGDS